MNSINKNILQIKETPIMEIANYGRNFTKETGKVVYPAWFGEGNISTDKLIYNETINALKAGETFILIRMEFLRLGKKYPNI